MESILSGLKIGEAEGHCAECGLDSFRICSRIVEADFYGAIRLSDTQEFSDALQEAWSPPRESDGHSNRLVHLESVRFPDHGEPLALSYPNPGTGLRDRFLDRLWEGGPSSEDHEVGKGDDTWRQPRLNNSLSPAPGALGAGFKELKTTDIRPGGGLKGEHSRGFISYHRDALTPTHGDEK